MSQIFLFLATDRILGLQNQELYQRKPGHLSLGLVGTAETVEARKQNPPTALFWCKSSGWAALVPMD